MATAHIVIPQRSERTLHPKFSSFSLQSIFSSGKPSLSEKPSDPELGLHPSSPTNLLPKPEDFPDGGLKAWSVVAGAWCCLFVSFGWITCIGVFQNYYQRNQLANYSPSAVGWISSMETFMMFVGAPIFGKVGDSYGAKPLLIFGTFCHILGLMMTSLSTQYYQIFLSQGVLSAMGASALFYGANNTIATWFFKKRAFALGIISSGSSLSGVVGPIMLERLLPQIGFGWTMRTVAFIYLFLCIIGILTVESRIPPQKRPFQFKEFLVPFKEPAFLLTAMASYFFFWGVFLPQTFMILQARYNGMSARLAGYLLAILNAGSFFGRIVPGWIGDKLGRFNVMITNTFLTGLLVLALWIPGRTNAAMIVFAALFGFTSGTFVSMVPALVAQITKDVRKIGVRTGSTFFMVALASLTTNPIGGALIMENDGGYLYMQIFCGIVMLIGAVLFAFARYVQVGWKGKV